MTLNEYLSRRKALTLKGDKINTIEEELWKDIDGYNGKYQISNKGRVKNTVTTLILSQPKGANGVPVVGLRENKKTKVYQVKTLVATYFLKKIDGKTSLLNKDGDLLNNSSENLEYVTLNEFLSTRVTQSKDTREKQNVEYKDEIWKQLEEHDMYEISNYGRTRNKNSKYITKLSTDKRGYIYAKFQYNTKSVNISISRSVAKYFVDNPDNKPVVIHIDKDKTNNKASNLKWVYQYECNAHYNEITNKMKNKEAKNKKNEIIKKHKIITKKTKELVEEWKIIKDFPNYQISNFGNVRYIKNKKLRKLYIQDGYYMVTLNRKTIRINIAVAKAFIKIPEELNDCKNIVIDHIDKNRLNNRIDNLRWLTQSGNIHSHNVNYKDKSYYKTILQYDANDKFIKEWSNIEEIINQNPTFHESGIYSVCRGYSITSYNYKWKYKDERIEPEIKDDEIFKNCGIIDGKDFSDYDISNYGNVKSLKNKNEIILKPNNCGPYYNVLLYTKKSKKQYRKSIHILVAELFVKSKTEKLNVVNHLDENKHNNYYKNLEWSSIGLNTEYSLGKKVSMIDIDTDDIIKTFDSMASACEHLNKPRKSQSNISVVCSGKRQTAFGYKWSIAY